MFLSSSFHELSINLRPRLLAVEKTKVLFWFPRLSFILGKNCFLLRPSHTLECFRLLRIIEFTCDRGAPCPQLLHLFFSKPILHHRACIHHCCKGQPHLLDSPSGISNFSLSNMDTDPPSSVNHSSGFSFPNILSLSLPLFLSLSLPTAHPHTHTHTNTNINHV